jgi:spore coat polysaccharide biosynthesis protein SpsF
MEVLGRPILEYQIERLKTAVLPDVFVLCTTQLQEDDILVDLAQRNGLQSFRGNAEDVLDRMLQAAKLYQIDLIVNVGGDDVFLVPECVDLVIENFSRTSADFIYCAPLPVGGTPFGIKTQALEHLLKVKTGGTDGWERYFKETGLFQVECIPSPDPVLCRPELRMTLDYLEDFQFFQAVINELYPRKRIFPLKDVIALMDSRPEIMELAQKRAAEWLAKHVSFDIAVKQDSTKAEEKSTLQK